LFKITCTAMKTKSKFISCVWIPNYWHYYLAYILCLIIIIGCRVKSNLIIIVHLQYLFLFDQIHVWCFLSANDSCGMNKSMTFNEGEGERPRRSRFQFMSGNIIENLVCLKNCIFFVCIILLYNFVQWCKMHISKHFGILFYTLHHHILIITMKYGVRRKFSDKMLSYGNVIFSRNYHNICAIFFTLLSLLSISHLKQI
jgi:hypothetical protein